MSSYAIKTENLGKRYTIAGNAADAPTSFRDLIVSTSKNFARTITGRNTPGVGANSQSFWALRNLSLEIAPGEVVGVVGRNGAGKSTLLKLLSRITEPTEGVIRYRGRIASLLEVGTGFHPELSGRENIFLNGSVLGMTKAEIRSKFDEIVAFAEVERFLDTPVKRYSSGMYVRLAFAVAAHLEPEILLVDEVLAVGDSAFQRKCIGKMQDVAARGGRTVLFVSHNMQSVQSLCTAAVYLSQGQMVSRGGTRQVVSDYLLAMSNSGNRKVWEENERPGDDYVRLEEVHVRSDALTSATFASREPLHVELGFEVLEHHPALCVGFDLMNSEGLTVLRSYQTDGGEGKWPPAGVGKHRWRCTIPPGLLNAGIYYISPRISLHNIKYNVQIDAVVEMELVLDHGVSPFWNSLGNSRPGVVAPVFQWTVLDEPAAAS